MTDEGEDDNKKAVGRPAPNTTKWPIYVKKSTKEALEQMAGSGYNGASQIAARLLDRIVDTLPLETWKSGSEG